MESPDVLERSILPHHTGYLFPGKHKAKEHIGIPSALVLVDAFLDPLCPSCKKAFHELKRVVEHYATRDGDRATPSLQLRVVAYPRSWEGPGGMLLAKAGAVMFLHAGNEAFFDFLELAFENQDKFKADNLMDKTNRQIYFEMIGQELLGQLRERGHTITETEFSKMSEELKPTIQALLGNNIKSGIQLGVTRFPRIFVNGLEHEEITSDFSLDQYTKFFDKILSTGLARPTSRA